MYGLLLFFVFEGILDKLNNLFLNDHSEKA